MIRSAIVGALMTATIAPAVASAAAPPRAAGTVQTFTVPSRHQARDRRVWVYTPPGYTAASDTSLGMILAFDGREYLEDFHVADMLDSLIAARAIPRVIAVLIDDSTTAARLDDLANRAWFVDWIADEVVPWARSRWNLSHDPARSLITGSSAGGIAALHIALRRPDCFGNVVSQSGAFWRGNEASNDPPYEWLTGQVARWPRAAVRLWLEVGSTETRGALGGAAPSILDANRAMVRALRAKHHDLTYVEVPGGVHGMETWAPRLPFGLAGLLGHR
jgi:enterochelin esterase-like enzyme